MKVFQRNFAKRFEKSQEETLLDDLILHGFNYLVVGVILLVNLLLRKLIIKLSFYERRKSYTEYLYTQIHKIFLFMFGNPGIIVLFTIRAGSSFTNFFELLFDNEGIVNSVQIVMLASFITPILWSLFHPLHLIKTLRYRILRKI